MTKIPVFKSRNKKSYTSFNSRISGSHMLFFMNTRPFWSLQNICVLFFLFILLITEKVAYTLKYPFSNNLISPYKNGINVKLFYVIMSPQRHRRAQRFHEQ